MCYLMPFNMLTTGWVFVSELWVLLQCAINVRKSSIFKSLITCRQFYLKLFVSTNTRLVGLHKYRNIGQYV